MNKSCLACGKGFKTIRSIRKYCSRNCSNIQTAQKHIEELSNIKPQTIWSCGAGVDSTAIAILIITGKIPKPDVSIMVDTGFETQSTYSHINNILIPELNKIGIELKLLKASDYHQIEFIDKHGFVLIPAYEGNKKYWTRCNVVWKVKTMKRYIKQLGIQRVNNVIGIAFDEAKRCRYADLNGWSNSYPLVDAKLTRSKCIELIARFGWPVPDRTSCYFCPNRSKQDWIDLIHNDPTDFNRACNAEWEIQKVKPNVYLHRSLKPLRQAMADMEGVRGVKSCAY